ncbi:MAG: hydrogenobyrinic acid a,c-diamide synthase (glutamine-hydrolyzing) [Proteobacteria bacterium]|nr:hydrogenobyrinic acid a,c-diamide synthase (glutamine-hydrolyzing) [Pseudomonadota bacterium]
MPPRIMIAAPGGRSGKTIVSIGLCDAFRRRGFTVQPFKKGPDYIDASWLTAASGRNCRNLDAFLMDEKTLLRSFEQTTNKADLVLIEGNMGFYDGIDPDGTGSSAHLSRLLKTPVILVVNTSRMSRSAAALIKGFQNFEPETQIAGVILNNVSGERHKSKLIQAIERYCHIPVVGAIPKIQNLSITERHLGLIPFNESTSGASDITDIGTFVERHLDLDAILSIAQNEQSEQSEQINSSDGPGDSQKTNPVVRIGVVFDKIFNFYYPENLEALTQAGAEIVYIDSLKDRILPEIDGLYIGGGFPELHLEELWDNRSLMNDIVVAIEGGLTVYAECAGLMYLSRGIRTNGKLYKMAGIIPSEAELSRRPFGHGYVEAEIVHENPFFPMGTILRGHEFHHSKLSSVNDLRCAIRIKRGYGINGTVDGIVYKNMFAAYTHLHALGTPEWADAFVSSVLKHKKYAYKEITKEGLWQQSVQYVK